MMEMWEAGPEDFPAGLDVVPVHHPSMVERVIRVLLYCAGIIALVLASMLMLTFIRLGLNLGDAVDRVNAPDPIVTGCPAGDGECGG